LSFRISNWRISLCNSIVSTSDYHEIRRRALYVWHPIGRNPVPDILFWTVLHPSRNVYAIKGVASIPLIEDRARTAVKALVPRNTALARASLLLNETLDTIDPVPGPEPGARENNVPVISPKHHSRAVQFAPVFQVKVLSPVSTTLNVTAEPHDISRPPSPSGSEISLPSSEHSDAPNSVTQAVASKLSFWSPVLKRTKSTSTDVTELVESPTVQTALEKDLHDAMEEEKHPATVLDSILTEAAPEPISEEEKYTQLEAKVVKECIREFTKGGMYFAYNFGTSTGVGEAHC
jgi:phosphatidylinositol 4-phosphatase